jgi:hypothetical protein
VTDDERQELKDQIMVAQLDKIAFDKNHANRQASWDVRKFIATTIISTVVALAAAVGAGIAIGSYYAHREPQPTAQQIILPPGTVITIPPAPK